MMKNDLSIGKETLGIGAHLPLREHGKMHKLWQIFKFVGDFPGMTAKQIIDAGVKPYEVLTFEGNLLLNSGINNLLTKGLVGSMDHPIDNTYGCMGVGDSNTAAAAGQTGLQAATNHLWVVLSATPTVGSSQQIVASASFASGQANWDWEEICLGMVPSGLPLDSANPTGGYALNRLVQSMGTKASGTTWVPTLTITFS